MSFVSVLANNKTITVVTDGRVTNVISGEIIGEDYKKFKLINEKQFIAFAGSRDVCELIVDQVEYLNNGIYDLEQLAQQLFNVTRNHEIIINNDIKALFIVGGVGKEENIEFYTIDRNKESIIHHNPLLDDKVMFAYIQSSNKDVDIEGKLNEISDAIGVDSVFKRFAVQEKLNELVAKQDKSVGFNTFRLRIRK